MNRSATQAAAVVERLQREIREKVAPLLGGYPLTLVDFPDHSNVGDSAIWLGEKAHFARFGHRVSRVAKQGLSRDLVAGLADGLLCIHGGGNFGDVWPRHQTFRESLMARFRHVPILQLPQSIHFADSGKIESAATAIAGHGNVTLLVRDEASLDLARRHFDCRSELCPDMAFCIGPVARACAPSIDVLGILRQDKEATGRFDAPHLARHIRVEDWIGDVAWELRMARLGGLLLALPSLDREVARSEVYDSLAKARFKRGVRQLSRARTVVTDRLHAHIICLLMGIPHAVLDNSYGKIGRFMSAFRTRTDDVHVASDLSEAVDWARERARRPVRPR